MLKLVIELSDDDLRYFRGVLQKVRKGDSAGDEEVILEGARELMTEVEKAKAPEYVRDRFEKLEQLIEMLEDAEWRLTGADRARVRDALAYFVDPDDLIPDKIPGLGYLDDAIMVELVVQELRHEIDAYERFCEFRRSKQPNPDAIERQRVNLQTRMRRRRKADKEKRRSRKVRGRSPLSLW